MALSQEEFAALLAKNPTISGAKFNPDGGIHFSFKPDSLPVGTQPGGSKPVDPNFVGPPALDPANKTTAFQRSKVGGVLGNIGSQIQYNPVGASRLFADIGQAITAGYPNSWQNQLSGKMGQQVAAKQQEMIRSGSPPTGLNAYGITPQERAQMVEEALIGQKMELMKRGAAVEEGRLAETTRASMAQEAAAGRSAAVSEREATVREKLEGKTARGMTPEEEIKMRLDLANIAAQASIDRTAGRAPRALNLPETTRQNLMSRVFDRLRLKFPNESWGRGKIELNNLVNMIAKNKIPESVLKDPEASALLNVYQALSANQDRDPEMTEQILNSLSKVFPEFGIGGTTAPVQSGNTFDVFAK